MKPSKISKQLASTTTIPLSEMTIIPPKGKSDWENGEVPNKEYRPKNQGKSSMEEKNSILDQALQGNYSKEPPASDAIDVNIEGISNTYGVAPPDTDGDVGLNHYIQMVNNGFQIFDKSGTALTVPADLETIWANLPGPWVGNYGDPVVLYDELADRWLLTQFSLPGSFYLLLAVSATSDPLGSYHLYVYEFDNMPDYPKFGVWPDGYYASFNQFKKQGPNWKFAGAGAVVFERAEILEGYDANMIFFSFTSMDDPWSFLPADFDGAPPPADEPNYFAYIDYWSGTDRLRVFEFHTDWQVMTNSSFMGPYDVNVAPFASDASDVPQIGSTVDLDVISDRLMFRLQYRNFGTYQTMVTNHTVNAGSGRAGIRWYELRDVDTGWSIYQQGSYAPDDGLFRWMASAAMNGEGNIAIGYSVSGESIHPQIRYTGRVAGDPPGDMTIPEMTIHAGSYSQSGTNRWGDYSAMSVDPSDNSTFWYTQEYSNGGWNWRTRISSFNLESPALTADFTSDQQEIMVDNTISFTDMSLGEPVSWEWVFEGATPASFSGQSPPPIAYATDGFFDVSLTVMDGIGSHTTTRPHYINVANCNYCPSVYSNTSDDWISEVTFNTLSNVSGSGGYENFSTLVTTVERDQSYGLSVAIEVLGVYTQHCFAFFDWNQDCDFADAGESYDLGQVAGSGTLSTNVTVPANANLGLTQMRIAERWDADPGPCDNDTYGEVEDYTINVTGGIQEFSFWVNLEGPYSGSDMNPGLISVIPLAQPFNSSPWNYPGLESVEVLPNLDIVDWLLVELREAATPDLAFSSTVLTKQAAFLLADGRIVGMDGASDLQFNIAASDNIYVLLWQRNHLPILSKQAVLPMGETYYYDFRGRADKALGDLEAQKQLAPGIWGMISGDSNADGIVSDSDKSTLWNNEAGMPGYLPSDFNLDGQSDNADKDDHWLPNLGKSSQVPD